MRSQTFRAGLLLALALVPGRWAVLDAHTATADSARIERLAALGRLWVSIKYFHPWLAYRSVNWDAALATAVPLVNAAQDRAGYAAAVQRMLDALGDPVTTVRRERAPAPPPSRGEPDPRSWWTRDSVLVVSLRNPTDLDDFNHTIDRLTAIADTVRTARRVVFDLRVADGEGTAIDWVMQESRILSLFTASPVRAPDQRGRLHSGFVSEDGRFSGGYYSGFYTVDGAALMPVDDTAAARSAVILVNEGSYIPQGMLALREAGRTRIVAEGSANDAGVVLTYGWRLPDSVKVSIRLTELLSAGGQVTSLADTVVPSDAGLAAAVAAFGHPPLARTHASAWRPALALARPDSTADPAYPDLPYRLLAAFKIWAIGQYFFPYRDLMNERWDQVLTRSLQQVESAHDSLEYGLALATMATHLHDSHVRLTSPAIRAHFGVGRAPVYIRMIEGQPVIAHFMDDSALAGGARVGDIVVAVDGEDARARMHRLERYISASTPQALQRYAALRLTGGPVGTTVTLRLRGAGGAERTVTMTRSEAFDLTGRSGPMFRVLRGNIGYADLGRLPASQVDNMFERLKDTRGDHLRHARLSVRHRLEHRATAHQEGHAGGGTVQSSERHDTRHHRAHRIQFYPDAAAHRSVALPGADGHAHRRADAEPGGAHGLVPGGGEWDQVHRLTDGRGQRRRHDGAASGTGSDVVQRARGPACRRTAASAPWPTAGRTRAADDRRGARRTG